MLEYALEVPHPIEVVASPGLASQLEFERVLVVELASRAVALRSTATELETRMANERIDADTAAWMMLRLQQFLVEWRDEAEAEAAAVILGAEQHGAQILREARGMPLSFAGAFAERRWVPDVLPALPETLIGWTAPAASATPEAPIHTAPSSLPAVGTPCPAPVSWPPGPAPTAVADHDEIPAAAGATLSPVDPSPAPTPVHIDLVAEGATGAIDDAGSSEDRAFWPEEGRRIGLRRRRASATVVLQVLAGLSAIAAVAVRLV